MNGPFTILARTYSQNCSEVETDFLGSLRNLPKTMFPKLSRSLNVPGLTLSNVFRTRDGPSEALKLARNCSLKCSNRCPWKMLRTRDGLSETPELSRTIYPKIEKEACHWLFLSQLRTSPPFLRGFLYIILFCNTKFTV